MLESVRIGAILLAPYLPDTSAKILKSLNTTATNYDDVKEFGLLETDVRVAENPEILFARIDSNEVNTKVESIEKFQQATKQKEAERKEEIGSEELEKIDLRIGKVLSCERHPNADKLFILKVDLGAGEVRQIVSGLAQSYTPGQVIGKNIVVVANLKPAVIRGVESEGMLLAGKLGNQISVVEVNGLEPGAKVS